MGPGTVDQCLIERDVHRRDESKTSQDGNSKQSKWIIEVETAEPALFLVARKHGLCDSSGDLLIVN